MGAFFFVKKSAVQTQALFFLPFEHLHGVDQHFVRLEHTLIYQHVVHLQLIRNVRNRDAFATQLLNFSSHVRPVTHNQKIQSRGFRLFYADFRKLVRFFLLQDNKRWHVDIPYGEHLEASAEFEMQGVEVYHASLLEPPKRRRPRRVQRYT